MAWISSGRTRGRLLVFNFQLVHDLSHVRRCRDDLFDHGTLRLGADLALERYDSLLDVVSYVAIPFVFCEYGAHILFDRLVGVRLNVLRRALLAWRPDRNLIGDHLTGRGGASDRFGLGFVGVIAYRSSQCHDSLVAILVDIYVAKTRLLKTLFDGVFYVRCFRLLPATSKGQKSHREKRYCQR